jgi:hypothetical protein
MTTRKEWLANEKRTNAEVLKRAGRRCERCHGMGDFRGLAISHTDAKGMGGTRHLYTADEKQLLCAVCHNTSEDLHNLREVQA